MISCEICGLRFDTLGSHLRFKHGLSTLEYWGKFPGCPTVSGSYRESQSDAAYKAYEVDPSIKSRLSCSNAEAYRNTPGLYENTVAQLKESTDKRWSAEGAREHASKTTSRSARVVWSRYTEEEKLARLRSSLHSPESLARSQESTRKGYSSTEEELLPILEKYFPGKFIWNKDKIRNIGGRFPDFFCDESKVVVECFGEPWHDGPDEEELKIEHYRKYGWSCFVLWANSPLDVVLSISDIQEGVSKLLD